MPYRDLIPFSRSAHDLLYLNDAAILLMVCWERDPVRYSDLTCKEVKLIMKYINDRDRIQKEEQVRQYYEQFERYALRNEEIRLSCEKAYTEAAKKNKVLRNMHTDYFKTLVMGKIWTQLSDFQISKVYAYRIFQEYRVWPWSKFHMEDWIPHEFKGKEWELPMRALDWAKRVRRDEMSRAIYTTSTEKMKWKAMAQKALGSDVIPTR